MFFHMDFRPWHSVSCCCQEVTLNCGDGSECTCVLEFFKKRKEVYTDFALCIYILISTISGVFLIFKINEQAIPGFLFHLFLSFFLF